MFAFLARRLNLARELAPRLSDLGGEAHRLLFVDPEHGEECVALDVVLIDDPADEGTHRRRGFRLVLEQVVQFDLLAGQRQKGTHRERGFP